MPVCNPLIIKIISPTFSPSTHTMLSSPLPSSHFGHNQMFQIVNKRLVSDILAVMIIAGIDLLSHFFFQSQPVSVVINVS